jgi:23S rRNA (guanosine2251-2'-O)-methyltransferase
MKGNREGAGRRGSKIKSKNKTTNGFRPSRDHRFKGKDKPPASSLSVRVSLGIHAVREVLKVRPSEILKLIFRNNWDSSKDLQDLMREAKKHNLVIEERTSEALDRIGSHNQGIVCEINDRHKSVQIDEIGNGDSSTVLILDGVEDPHNLGAILRTAWLMGVEAIILPTDRAVGLTATVHKVSCGGVEHVPVLRVPNLSVAMELLKGKGFWIYGLSAEGSKTIGKLKISSKVAWALGAEDKGLRTTTERSCDDLVSIPQLDNAASYNVSVAAGITLYETSRQANSEKV